jgi:hypothetical protein
VAAMFFAIFLNVAGSPEVTDTLNDKTITGIIIKVDIKNRSIYIKENSRTVRFKASTEICEQYKSRINSEVEITYKIGSNKKLQIITIKLLEKKEDSK